MVWWGVSIRACLRIPMAHHEAQRYKIASGAERANSRLKEDFGANNVMLSSYCGHRSHQGQHNCFRRGTNMFVEAA